MPMYIVYVMYLDLSVTKVLRCNTDVYIYICGLKILNGSPKRNNI